MTQHMGPGQIPIDFLDFFFVEDALPRALGSAFAALSCQIVHNITCSILEDSMGSALGISADMRSTPGTLLDFIHLMAVSSSCS